MVGVELKNWLAKDNVIKKKVFLLANLHSSLGVALRVIQIDNVFYLEKKVGLVLYKNNNI